MSLKPPKKSDLDKNWPVKTGQRKSNQNII